MNEKSIKALRLARKPDLVLSGNRFWNEPLFPSGRLDNKTNQLVDEVEDCIKQNFIQKRDGHHYCKVMKFEIDEVMVYCSPSDFKDVEKMLIECGFKIARKYDGKVQVYKNKTIEGSATFIIKTKDSKIN